VCVCNFSPSDGVCLFDTWRFLVFGLFPHLSTGVGWGLGGEERAEISGVEIKHIYTYQIYNKCIKLPFKLHWGLREGGGYRFKSKTVKPLKLLSWCLSCGVVLGESGEPRQGGSEGQGKGKRSGRWRWKRTSDPEAGAHEATECHALRPIPPPAAAFALPHNVYVHVCPRTSTPGLPPVIRPCGLGRLYVM